MRNLEERLHVVRHQLTGSQNKISDQQGPWPHDLVKEKDLLAQYEHKKARIDWTHFRDNNTTYFHALVNRRRTTNRIRDLTDDQGRI